MSGEVVTMRIDIIAVLCTALGLGSCTVVGVAADAASVAVEGASVAGSVVSTTVSTAGDVVGAAAHTVSGSSSDQNKKPQ